MAGKKGAIPSHIQKREYSHPEKDSTLIRILEEVEDPRKPSLNFKYSLTSVLFMVLSATVCGATDWPKVKVMCEGMRDWLSQFVDMSEGVPCERTFKTLFNLIDNKALEDSLIQIAEHLKEESDQDIISFDGQTKRGTADEWKALSGLHLLSAWSTQNQLCLGQLKVDDKSNEIPAMPELMDLIDLKGAIITADAMNTQRKTVEKALEKKADYVLPLKGNQPDSLREVELAFEGFDQELAKARVKYELELEKATANRDRERLKKLESRGVPTCGACTLEDELEKSRGRVEVRSCVALSAHGLPFATKWEGLESIVRIERERTLKGQTSNETIYYITSLKKKHVSLIADAIRSHWGVENGLHYRLDVVFRQDKSRYRDRVGAANQAVLYKMALNALQKDEELGKYGMATKQCRAACDPVYRTKLIKKCF